MWPYPQLHTTLCQTLDLAEPPDQLWEQYRRSMPQLASCRAEDLDALRQLRRAGWRIGIVTNGMTDSQLGKIRNTGLSDLVVRSSERCIAFPGGRHRAVAFRAAFVAGALRATVTVFCAGARFAGAAFPAAVAFLAAVAFFAEARAAGGLFFGPFAAVAPVARLVAVATFFAAAVLFPGAFLAPVAFLAAAGLVAVRVLPPLPFACRFG